MIVIENIKNSIPHIAGYDSAISTLDALTTIPIIRYSGLHPYVLAIGAPLPMTQSHDNIFDDIAIFLILAIWANASLSPV